MKNEINEDGFKNIRSRIRKLAAEQVSLRGQLDDLNTRVFKIAKDQLYQNIKKCLSSHVIKDDKMKRVEEEYEELKEFGIPIPEWVKELMNQLIVKKVSES